MKNKEMPTIDDEFVKDISEYDTLAEYREYLSKRLLKNAEKQAQSEFETEVARLVVEGAEIDVPNPRNIIWMDDWAFFNI